MSFVTRCPACRTLFKVQAETLAPSAGKGRCSACQHIFNALEHRFDPALPETSTTEYVEIATVENPVTETPSFSETWNMAEAAAEETPTAVEEATAELPPVTAVPETLFRKRRINWLKLAKPLLAAVFLLLALLAQIALFFRAPLVAHYPRSYQVLAALCNVLDCSVELPRRAGLIQIEDHSLRSDPQHADVLVLEGLIKNSAPYPQAYPLLQLTLTSKLNFALADRSFTPAEYLPKPTDIAAGMAAGGRVNIRMNLGVAGNQSSSYQLIAKDQTGR